MANTTWNSGDKSAGVTLTGSNLIATVGSAGFQGARSVYSTASGKYYWEWTYGTNVTMSCGIGLSTLSLTAAGGANGIVGGAVANIVGSIFINSTSSSASLGSLAGSLVGIALNLDTQLIWFRKGAAGNWNNSGTANPATGLGGFTLTFVGGGGTAAYAYMTATSASGGSVNANFGDTAFTGTPPATYFLGFPGTAPAVGGSNPISVAVLA